MIEHYALESPAWEATTPNERALFIEVLQRHNGHNNGSIGLGVREAGKALGIKPHTAGIAFDGLVALGFLRVARASAFSLKTREAREWIITMLPVGAELPTKEFMRWQGTRESRTQCRLGIQTVSPNGTVTPSTVSPNGTDGVPKRHREGQNDPLHGVPKRHTSILPRETPADEHD